MYDSILYYSAVADRTSTILHDLGVSTPNYYLATLHRAENTDDPVRLKSFLPPSMRLRKTLLSSFRSTRGRRR